MILTLSLLMAVSAKAQIFRMEDEAGDRADIEPTLGIDMPNYSDANDYYVPMGSGLLMLTAFGGIYLLKSKKDNK